MSVSRWRGPVAALAGLAVVTLVPGCTTSLMSQSAPASVAAGDGDGAASDAAIANASRLASEYDARPGDIAIGFRYASALKAIGSDARALEVLEEVATHNPDNRDAITTYGKALAEAGRGAEANGVLARAETLGEPDWKLYSARGMAHDQAGNYEAARVEYARAAELAPDEATIYNNWGLSHALSGNLVEAEAMLARASELPGADRKVRANLALVLGLQGKFDEAEKVDAVDLPPDVARANAEYLREMLKQPDAWDLLRNGGGKGAA